MRKERKVNAQILTNFAWIIRKKGVIQIYLESFRLYIDSSAMIVFLHKECLESTVLSYFVASIEFEKNGRSK